MHLTPGEIVHLTFNDDLVGKLPLVVYYKDGDVRCAVDTSSEHFVPITAEHEAHVHEFCDYLVRKFQPIYGH